MAYPIKTPPPLAIKEIELSRPLNGHTLAHADLSELTGYTRPGDLSRYLSQNGVRYFVGKAGIWTTVDALNAALGLSVATNTPKPFI